MVGPASKIIARFMVKNVYEGVQVNGRKQKNGENHYSPILLLLGLVLHTFYCFFFCTVLSVVFDAIISEVFLCPLAGYVVNMFRLLGDSWCEVV